MILYICLFKVKKNAFITINVKYNFFFLKETNFEYATLSWFYVIYIYMIKRIFKQTISKEIM